RARARSGPAVAFSSPQTFRESPANDRRPHTTSDACGGRVDSTRCTDGQSRGRPMISSAGTALRRLFGGGLLAGILASALPAQSAAPRIALVLDQQAPRVPAQVAAFQRELQGFFRPG